MDDRLKAYSVRRNKINYSTAFPLYLEMESITPSQGKVRTVYRPLVVSTISL